MNKKKFCLFTAVVLLCALMPLMLTACMKINMSKEKIVTRLKDNGYVISYLSKTNWTAESAANYVDITETIEANNNNLKVYVYFCKNSKSAKWVEKMCEDNSSTSQGAAKSYITYYYENNFIIIYGDYSAVAIARNY